MDINDFYPSPKHQGKTDVSERMVARITAAIWLTGLCASRASADTLAHTAILAMREPTEAMTQAANDAPHDCADCGGHQPLETWQAMIDEALK